MYQDPYHSFGAFLTSLRNTGPEMLPDLDQIASFLAPFLANPEKHSEHVKKLLQAAANSEIYRVAKPLLKLYDSPPIRWIFPLRDKLKELTKKFAEEVEQLGPSLRDTVQPAELAIDILPVRASKTDPSYAAIGMGAIYTEVKVGVRPTEGFNVRQISLDIEFERSKGIQILSASPETEYEILGDREIQTGESGKRSTTFSGQAQADIGAKAFGYEARVKFVDSETQQTEYAQSISKVIKDRPTIPRVSCMDVGANVHWDLYETPTQKPIGGLRFSCNLLAPRVEKKLKVVVILTANISSWGPVSKRCQDDITLVFQE